MSELARFTVTMPEELLSQLDAYAARRGITNNRSEAIRDLVRGALVSEATEDPGAYVFGTLTMVFDHHSHDLRDKLDDIQHHHVSEIVSSLHVHVNEHMCLEVVVMRGRAETVHTIADALLGTKGVLNGQLVVTTVDGEA